MHSIRDTAAYHFFAAGIVAEGNRWTSQERPGTRIIRWRGIYQG